jgi:hypothetical protein
LSHSINFGTFNIKPKLTIILMMKQDIYQVDVTKARNFLYQLVMDQGPENAAFWLDQQTEKIKNDATNKTLYISFSASPRFVGKGPLRLSEKEIQTAQSLREGFTLTDWTIDQAARVYFLLLIPAEDENHYLRTLEMLFNAADVKEQKALYSALPLLAHPKKLTKRAAEGIRTNMTVVFDAIALQNPYPAEYLDENAWNQMLLKAVFIGRPLYKIYRSDERANPKLAQMLRDFAHERWAAGRPVTPELWRYVAPFADESYMADIEKILNEGDSLVREAGALVCWQSDNAKVKALLDQQPELKAKVADGKLNWNDLGQRYLESK